MRTFRVEFEDGSADMIRADGCHTYDDGELMLYDRRGLFHKRVVAAYARGAWSKVYELERTTTIAQTQEKT